MEKKLEVYEPYGADEGLNKLARLHKKLFRDKSLEDFEGEFECIAQGHFTGAKEGSNAETFFLAVEKYLQESYN